MKLYKYSIFIICYIVLCSCSANLREVTGKQIKYPTSKGDVISLLTGDSTKLWICPKWHIAYSFSKIGFLYKAYIIKDDGTFVLYMTPQEEVATTVFDINNMKIQILLKGRDKMDRRVLWDQYNIKYISQDTLIILNPVREVLFINSNKYNAVQKSK